MKVWKNKKGVSPVIATILMVAITVVLAAVLYVMVMGMMSGPGTVSAPLGLYAKYVNGQTVTITVNSAPANAPLNGTNVVIVNASSGLLVSGAVTVYDAGGTSVGSAAAGAAITSPTGRNWAPGFTIRVVLSGANYLSVGDKVQISGTGFSTSTSTIVS
ncbi:MAG: type IV pilin N-terminal domain-containing protein [Thermoplasmata archaeon]